ncbi:hypothetical protein ACFVHW_11490 [Streptomyces sp. NPDC127110]
MAPVGGWCEEHGNDAGPVMERHPGGGLRCAELAELAGRRVRASVRG